MYNADQIMAILRDLKLSVVLNHSAITKRHEIIHIMLIRQYIRKTVSNHKITMKYY